MGLLASLPTPVDSRWPIGWQLSVDPATRAFLNVLRRLYPGAYSEAQDEAQGQVRKLIEGVVPEGTDQKVDYDELAQRLDLDPTQDADQSPGDAEGDSGGASGGESGGEG